MMIPEGLCEEIGRMVRQFVWGTSSSGRKMALILKLSGSKFFELNMGLLKFCLTHYRVANVLFCGKPLQMYGSLFVRICFGQWDMGKVSDVSRISGYQLLEVIIRKITGVPPPHLAAGTNRIIWGGSQRVRFFIWLEHSSVCGVCGDISKDILHAIRDCNAAETVRNRNGKWIFGFNRFLGSYYVFEAELWGILDGLSTLIKWGYDNVIIQTNSLEAATIFQRRPTKRPNSALIKRIFQLLT
ncbi:hypothetical protein Goari_005996 [Gossypium aridum]|uniref:RNase H type-1 domain-containing protein n=1 Tax=Gossypium aridum TaxID=34290 RepID=A0A7J8XLR0_GOSAI|nr:hypothetical protein [Gossypium aridum]